MAVRQSWYRRKYSLFLTYIDFVKRSCVPLTKAQKLADCSIASYLQRLAAKSFLWRNRDTDKGQERFIEYAKDYYEQCKKFTLNQEEGMLCSADHKVLYKCVNKKLNVAKYRCPKKRTFSLLDALQHKCIEHYRKAFITYRHPILEYCS